MNLQESIRRILRKPVNESTYFRRRVDMSLLDKKFFTNLNLVTDKYLIIIKEKDEISGIGAEYSWLRQNYPGCRLKPIKITPTIS